MPHILPVALISVPLWMIAAILAIWCYDSVTSPKPVEVTIDTAPPDSRPKRTTSDSIHLRITANDQQLVESLRLQGYRVAHVGSGNGEWLVTMVKIIEKEPVRLARKSYRSRYLRELRS